MTFSKESPFTGPVPETVPLPRTPLTGVLAQIRFPEVLSIAKPDYIADFQERIRRAYPLSSQDQNLLLQITPDGAKRSTSPTWRFFDSQSEWRVSLATSFLALETRAYRNRADFSERMGFVAEALASTIDPGMMVRVGVRYVDRIHGPELKQLPRLIRPEVLGIYTDAHRDRIGRTISEVSGSADVGPMSSRWGFMPPSQTHDPDLMPPIGVASWFLDIDVYQEFSPPVSFVARDIEGRVMDLATRAYGFFRWVVSDEFLRTYGGEL